MKTLTNTFLKGLLFALPLLITFGSLYWLFMVAERYLRIPLEYVLPDGWYVTGMGLASSIVLIFVLGLLVQAYIIRGVLDYIVSLIEKIPVVKTLYNSAKDLLNFVAGEKNSHMQKVVSITFDKDIQMIGFVTNEDISLGDQSELISIYLPLSYQIGGFLMYLPKSRCTPLDIPVQKAMQQILTAHVASGSHKHDKADK